MKQMSTLRNVLVAVLAAASTVACGAEAPIEGGVAQEGQALSELTGLVNAKTGGYVSTLRLARSASASCAARSVVISGAGKSVQAKTCDGKSCASAPLSSIMFVDDDGVVAASDLALATIDDTKGDIEPVAVDDKLYLCKEDEKGGVCECIE